MPVSYQIIPEHTYPHQYTQINDNSEVATTYNTDYGVNSLLCVFASPKGREGMYTIENGEFGVTEEYGVGSFAHYGQPYLNMYAAASSGVATLHCLRVTAADATFACSNLIAKYKVEDTKMTIKFVNAGSDEDLTDLADLADCCVVSDLVDDEGFKAVKLFSVAYIGKGSWGKNLRWRIRSEKASDKLNDYKSYAFDVYEFENGLKMKESFAITFVEDSLYSGASLYAQDVINDSDTGSNKLKIVVNPAGFRALFDAYKAANPDTTYTINDFDPLLGIDKYTNKAIENIEIVPEALDAIEDGKSPIAINATSGVPLIGGTDGSIAIGAAGREEALNALYKDAFAGVLDPYIKSKNRFPVSLILDANYDVATKKQIVALTNQRKDCMCVLDCGLGITTKTSVAPYIKANLDDYANQRVHTIEPYCMKTRDPISQKTVTVTSTWWIARYMPVHFNNWNGKHKPMAGNRYGIISGHIKDSVYPVFDEDLDSELMDELAEMHVNFAKYNANQEVVRAMQDTRQNKLSNLSEMNNMLIVLDIKRDAERICSQFEYEFSEPNDIATFNAVLSGLTDKYAAAQVRSISAGFTKSKWEADHQIIHLNIEMVHKDLVRTTIIEIDVNRD